jgi:ABC-type bacteriocin/lantibiotic exporter with double-glycine peptidase domain
LFISEPNLTILVSLIFSIIGLSYYLIIKRKIDKASRQVNILNTEEAQTIIAVKQGIREILSFNNQESFLTKITEYMKKRVKYNLFIFISPYIPSCILEIAGFSTIMIILIYLIKINAEMSQIVASMSLLMLTAWRILPIISRVIANIVAIQGERHYSLACLDLLEKLRLDQPANYKIDYAFTFNNNIILKNISFQYPINTDNSIRNISLKIKKGEIIGLIGPSGSGKSTLALVLSGLVPIKDGQFLVDGLDMTPERILSFAGKVGFVPQTPFLMDGTVADNVAFSRWGREYDRQDVVKACKLAAMDFIFDHPDGLDMRISAGGQGLSGGQAQRVAIARAIFAKPQVIIFDEATSALDQWNENAIKQTIENMAGDVTIIIIAHRLTTVESCDQIYWLDNGMIKESGPPSIILPLYKQYSYLYDN